MGWFTKALSGSIGTKLIMSLSGLFLISFLIVHLIGNFTLMREDPESFLAYSAFMKHNPLIKLLEYILFAGFIFHIVYSIIVTAKSKKARPIGYAKSSPSANTSWFSRNMGLTGSIVFIFLVVHLRTFFVPHKLGLMDTKAPDLYQEAVLAFQSELYVGFYVVAMILLGFHLNHGFQSAFQTLGLRHPKYTPFVKGLGTTFAILIPGLFAMIPLYMYFTH